MSKCELGDEVGVAVALHVDEDSRCIRLEMNPKSQALEATEQLQNSTSFVVNKPFQDNAKNIENLQNSSTVKEANTEDQSSALKQENSVDAVPSNKQLSIDESRPDLTDPCIDRVESVNQTRLSPELLSRYSYCGTAINSTDPIHETKHTDVPSQIRSQDFKNVETKLTSVLEERLCRVVPPKACHSHRYFFPGTRSETLESIRRVAVNGTEALQNRLRMAVLRENEVRMDAEMARAEIEAAKTEKALAEILLDDTKNHEAMLQKDLQNAVTELQRGPYEDTKRSASSNGVLKSELRAIRAALDLEIQKREQSEAETRFFIKELQERQSTKTYVAQLEDEVRSLRKELSKIHSSIDERCNVFHSAQSMELTRNKRHLLLGMTNRVQQRTENNKCKYHSERPDRWYSVSRGETDRPTRSRQHGVVPSNASQHYIKTKPRPSHHKRSRTSSSEDVETQQKTEDSSLFLTEPPLPHRKLEYIPPVPPTRVTTEALRKARQDYMKETRRMQDRWHEITNER